MESSILSEVDDTSILRTELPRRYACPLNWLPASRLLPRAAGWSAATLCFGVLPLRDGLGRVTVLPQLKVDRLCSVVDGTAGFDPKRTSVTHLIGCEMPPGSLVLPVT